MSNTPNDIRRLLGLSTSASAQVSSTTTTDTSKVIPMTDKTDNSGSAQRSPDDIRKLLGLRSSSAKPGAQKSPSMDTLRGTGITKRMLASQEKAIERQQEGTSELESRPVVDAKLESTRMDLSNASLDASQIRAVQHTLVNRYACIVGSAGRGKTTVANTVINGWALALNGCYDEDLLFSNLTPDPKDWRFRLPETTQIAIVSYTGRAVQNIQRALPTYLHHKCKTIHSLLEYAPVEEEVEVEDPFDKNQTIWTTRRVFRPRRTEDYPLELEFLFIDEAGMTPIKPLWEELMAALPSTCRIVKLGDIQQIPPVHGRSTLGFSMLAWPSFELQKTWRQAGGTRIIDGADDILAGRVPRRDPEGGVHMVELPAGSMQSARVVKGIVRRLFQEGRWDPLNDAIIVPMNKYDLGQEQLNRDLVATFNPPRYIDGDKKRGLINPRITIRAGFENRVFAVGDKVMATQNDWENGIANGMVGVILSITSNPNYRGSLDGTGEINLDHDEDFDLDALEDLSIDDLEVSHPEEGATSKRQASHIIEVQFQNMEESVRFNTTGAVNSLNLGYVMTCHKAQGGEYKRVLVVCHSSAKAMLTREWLYTAWTRAKTELFVLGNARGLQMAVRNQSIKGKTLQEKARAFIALMDKGDDSVPTLPDPVEVGLPS